jgi:hypothetical protein
MFKFPTIKQFGLNCVYKITVGDYFYFVSTTCIRNRISSYKSGSYTTKLKNAIKKYGHCNLEIIKFTDTENECRDLELVYIKENIHSEFCLNTSKTKTPSKNRDDIYFKQTLYLETETYEKLLKLAERKKWSVTKTVEFILLKAVKDRTNAKESNT